MHAKCFIYFLLLLGQPVSHQHAQVVCERSNGVTITAGSHCTVMVNLQHNETVALCRE